MKTKKKNALFAFAAVLAVGILCAILFFALFCFRIGGKTYSHKITSIDLSGKDIDNPRRLSCCNELKNADLRGTGLTAEDYEYLTNALPDCKIIWDVPLFGEYFPEDTRELSLSSITEQDISAVKYLRELEYIDGRSCESLSLLGELKAAYPDITVSFNITIGKNKYENSESSVFLGDADISELIEKAAYFYSLNEVHLDGRLPSSESLSELLSLCPAAELFIDRNGCSFRLDRSSEIIFPEGIKLDSESADTLISYYSDAKEINLTESGLSGEEILTLVKKYPSIFFIWETDICGLETKTDITELDLSQITDISVSEIEKALPRLKKLEILKLPPLPGEDERIIALADSFPDIFFVWDMNLFGKNISTDSEEVDISGAQLNSVSEIEAYIPYFRNAKKVIMCSCGISNEEMDALNLRYENIQFVWEVWIGYVTLRTDAIYFAPFKYPTNVNSYSLINLKYCRDLICIDIGHQEVASCEWAAYMPNLQYLIIADTMISDISPLTGLTNLKFLEMFMTRVRDYTPLTTLTGLEDLNLCYTHGDPAPIEEMTWLKRLWWAGDYTAEAYLKDKLPDTEKQFHSGSSTGGTWRDGNLYKEQRDILGAAYFKG